MKVLSFNILAYGQGELEWKKRIPLVVRTIRNAEPDIFCLQEAHAGWMRALLAAFPDYATAGVGRDNGKKRGEYAPIFYLRERFSPLEQGNFWLSETPEKPSAGWDAAENMLCTWMKLTDLHTDKRLFLMNTHLDRSSPIAMGNSVQLIADYAAELGKDLPVIAAGTWNAPPENAVWKAFTERGLTDARDAAAEKDIGPTYHAYAPNDPAQQTIVDHIFIRNIAAVRRLKTVRKTVDGVLPSDHYPVVAEFSLYQ